MTGALGCEHHPPLGGGRTTWENIVTACAPCNLKKGAARPSMYELQELDRCFPPHYLHESWLDDLYWDIELEA